MAGLQKPISGLPSSSTFATADILPIVKSGNTDFITGGNFRTALFGIAQADPLSIGSLTAVGNSTITGTLSGITTFSAAAIVSSGPVQVTGGSQTAGSMWKSATGGLVVQSVAGSSTDFFLGNPGASPIMTVPTGTTNVVFAGSGSFGALVTASGGVTIPAGGLVVSAGLTTLAAGLTLTGTLTMATAVSKLVPGATSFSHRNNADTQDNLLIIDNGNVSVRGNITLGQSIGFLNAVAKIQVGATSLAIRDNADTTNLMLFSTPGVTLAVPLLTTASLTGQAGLNIPHGTAPTSPVNGDMWTTTGGAFVRINGVTKSINLT
jgi:hypothetical protein